MSMNLKIFFLIAVAFLSVSMESYSQTSLSRKEQKRQKAEEAVNEIMEIIQERHFCVDVHTITHAVNGSQIDMNKLNDEPFVLFRTDGIHVHLPYFTGVVPLDGVTGNDNMSSAMSGDDKHHGYTANFYPRTWIDCAFPYPSDYSCVRVKDKVTLSFSTQIDEGGVYLFMFEFFKRNCDFTIECKSFTKTEYRGHLISQD